MHASIRLAISLSISEKALQSGDHFNEAISMQFMLRAASKKLLTKFLEKIVSVVNFELASWRSFVLTNPVNAELR